MKLPSPLTGVATTDPVPALGVAGYLGGGVPLGSLGPTLR